MDLFDKLENIADKVEDITTKVEDIYPKINDMIDLSIDIKEKVEKYKVLEEKISQRLVESAKKITRTHVILLIGFIVIVVFLMLALNTFFFNLFKSIFTSSVLASTIYVLILVILLVIITINLRNLRTIF